VKQDVFYDFSLCNQTKFARDHWPVAIQRDMIKTGKLNHEARSKALAMAACPAATVLYASSLFAFAAPDVSVSA
jgi:hypothetical protein